MSTLISIFLYTTFFFFKRNTNNYLHFSDGENEVRLKQLAQSLRNRFRIENHSFGSKFSFPSISSFIRQVC